MLDKVTQDYADQIDLLKVDTEVEDNFDLLAQYDVKSIPTLVMLDANGNKLGALVGMQSEPVLREWFDNLLERTNEVVTKSS